MQPDISLTYISPENKRVWTGKHRRLARHGEVLRNIALQSGLPPLPRSRFTWFVEVMASCFGVGGVLTIAIVFSLAAVWLVSMDVNIPVFLRDLPFVGLAVLFSLLQVRSRFYARRARDLAVYPPYVIQSYEQLVTSGKVTVCDVQAVEPFEDSNYLVHYQFTPLESGESVKGQYVTSRPIQTGTNMAVLYLNTTYNVLL